MSLKFAWLWIVILEILHLPKGNVLAVRWPGAHISDAIARPAAALRVIPTSLSLL
ncbi:hypothetical protein [Streptomyces sp. NRRL S-244]|uniref:hypothetical protein n=1 Tax=Streptomyces sp. NRRL S-244 TaxID=1463897 RepID=UPI00131A5A70|nr:hypothetical protein [Streptomyces sp. NRRL S-244]